MTSLTTQADGGPPVTGDMFNTFEQTCDNVAQLRAFIGITGMQVYVRGTIAPNDGGQGPFYWNASGTAPDDNGVTTIVPTGSASGEWTRLPFSAIGDLTIAGNLTVNENASIAGNLSVAGTASFSNLSITNNLSAGNDLTIGGAAVITGAVTGGAATFASITTTGNAAVAGNLTVSGGLLNPVGGILGTTTNDNAVTGTVGEYISSTVLVGSAVALTTDTPANVTSIALTAGDWDVWANVWTSTGSGTVLTQFVVAVSDVSATFPTAPGDGAYTSWSGSLTTTNIGFTAGMARRSLALTTTVYLVVQASFSVDAEAAYGFIGARRVR